MMPRQIKWFWRLTVAMVLTVVCTAVAVWQWPGLSPSFSTSAVYKTYAAEQGIDATFLHNFPVNDTLAVDVTLLQATDSAGWERLKRDYGVREMPDIVMKKIEKGEDVVSVRYVNKSNPTLPADTVDMSNNNILAVSRLHRAVSVFHTETEAEQAAVNYNQLEIGLKTH